MIHIRASVVGVVILLVIAIAAGVALYKFLQELFLFKTGDNPYQRTCRKCGAQQEMYQSNVEGFEKIYWWEERFTFTSKPECKCHKYAK